MSLYFRPEKGVLGDVIPFYDNGVFKPFYLRNYRGNRDANHQDSWVMLSTTDHVHFTEHDTKIVGGTGSVIKVDGIYHMFFCTFQVMPEKNYINHAVSTNLDTWTEIPEDRFASDNQIYAPVHWRDPFVFWCEEENCWWMIFAAQKQGMTTRRGCVGLCKSDDLHHWSYCDPIYAPMNAQCAFECPDLFKMGDWYYLVFSSYADRYQTLYRKSRSLNGPWETPEIDTFDTRAFYAAKTGTDGVHRYVYGWNPTRENNEHHFDPLGYDGKDCNTWDWGGNLIVHELWQDENGDYWYRNGSEDEYIGEGNYAPDPDSGELMEGNDAGWTEQDGYFEPHYYYEDGSVWLEDATGTTYIGSRDKYYIDDYGNLQEYSESEAASSSGDSSEEYSKSEKRGELHMRVGFTADDTIRESMPEKEGYFEQRSVNEGKSTAFALKVANSSLEDSSLKGFLAEYYPVKGEIITQKDLTFESYPATKYQYLTAVNEEEKNVDALVCQTDDYTFGLFILTPSDAYDKVAEKKATELIKSIDFIYAESVDMAMTDYFQVLTPERWKYLCHYETTKTENGGYKLTYYNEDVPVLTLEARYYDGEDQPLDSVWQGYLGRIETVDGKKYDLLSTISQYSEDASDEWKEMYDTYLDTINGIRMMDGCSLTEGSHT